MSERDRVCEFHVENDPCRERVGFKLAPIKRVGTVEMIQFVCPRALDDATDFVIAGRWDGFQVTRI